MVTMRRCVRHTTLCVRRNKPSGLVIVIILAFIVAYAVIIKLDSDSKHSHTDKLKSPPTVRSMKFVNNNGQGGGDGVATKPPRDVIHFREGLMSKNNKTVPKAILEEFAEEELNNAGGDSKTVVYKLNDDLNKPGKEIKDEDNDIKDEDKYIRDEPTDHDDGEDKQDDDEADKDKSIGLPSENEQLMNDELERNEEEIESNWDQYLGKDTGKAPSKTKQNQLHLRFQGVRVAKKPVMKTSLFSHLPKYVQIFDIFNDSKKGRDSINKNKCILLRTLHGDSPICIHDPQDDEIISGSLLEKGTWEPNYLYITGSILKLYQDMVFLDLGCNIGVYTIMAAKIGHAVVSVDPYKLNLRLLTKSLGLGALRDRVTLLWNAVSDVHENVTVNGIIGNIGGTYVEPVKDAALDADEFDLATTIVLDDLIDMFIDKPVFIKMDVEAFELKALEGGPHFFKTIDVRFILMEWIAHRGSSNADKIIKVMAGYGLYPHVNAHHNTKLEREHSASWPDNVMWIKY